MASFEEESADSSSASSESLLQQIDSLAQLIHTSFDALIQVLTRRKQQHLDQLSSIKSQYESHVKSNKTDSEVSSRSSLKDFRIFRITWRFDKTYETLLSRLGQIDVLLGSEISPYQIFPENPLADAKTLKKTRSDGRFQEMKSYNSSISYFRSNWYILNEAQTIILVLDTHGDVIKQIPIKIRDAFIKTRSLAISDKYIFTWNKQENTLLTFTHDGRLMPHIPQSVEFKRPMNLAAGKDDYLAIADAGQNNVVLLQPYLNDKHRAIGFANHDPAFLVGPNDVCFTKDNSIVVVDYNNPCVHMYTIKGQWICSFGSNQMGQELKSPKNILVTDQGYAIVSCTHGFLRVYDPNTAVGYRIGRGSFMSERGQFWIPSKLACSEDGRFAVCNYDNNIVQFFNLSELASRNFFD